ncbi:MAG: DNA primase [Deltaproteobacteria bacterium]|nr:DNA primase [Deltaproteobacteria bacterium]
MMIPREKVDEVRERASIVQVISEYLPLTKRGHNHIGHCPFHSEKTPSFTVSEEKKIYYCFGCNSTGNVITFIMKKEGLSFPEAVKSLAKRYGITIPEAQRSGPDPRDVVYQALRASMEYFLRELKGPGGGAARGYLKKRGFEGDMASRFNLGFAPDSWGGLVGFLKGKGVSVDGALKAGVIIKKEKGYYDRFRGRVIFPITDVRGRIVGFGGRSLDNKEPKYLNSPESMVFKKGETLYGFYQAKQPIVKEGSAIVVEGYFDLLALHKHGFMNSVATMGTALTPEHLRLIKSYSTTVYALFDSDTAGKNAAIRSLQLSIEEEMDVRAVLLSDAKDPDEFLSKKGADAMREAISKAEPLMEFYLNELKKKLDITRPEGKRKYLDSATHYLLRIKNVAERGHYASIVASTLGVPPDSIYESLKLPAEKSGKGPPSLKDIIEAKNSKLMELTILKVIISHPELYKDDVASAIKAFSDPHLREIGEKIAECYLKGKKIDAGFIMEDIKDDSVRGTVAGLLFRVNDGFIEAPERMLEDSLKRVLNRGKIKDTTRHMIEKLEKMGEAEVASDMKKRVEAGITGKK